MMSIYEDMGLVAQTDEGMGPGELWSEHAERTTELHGRGVASIRMLAETATTAICDVGDSAIGDEDVFRRAADAFGQEVKPPLSPSESLQFGDYAVRAYRLVRYHRERELVAAAAY